MGASLDFHLDYHTGDRGWIEFAFRCQPPFTKISGVSAAGILGYELRLRRRGSVRVTSLMQQSFPCCERPSWVGGGVKSLGLGVQQRLCANFVKNSKVWLYTTRHGSTGLGETPEVPLVSWVVLATVLGVHRGPMNGRKR